MKHLIFLRATVVILITLLPCSNLFAAKKEIRNVSDPSIKWEAKVPKNHETSPYMLNLLMYEVREDMEELPNADTIVALKGKYDIKKYKFKKLLPRVKIDTFYEVALNPEYGEDLPIDMAGIGPFYLFKVDDVYHLLTPNNYQAIFGNIRTADEAMDYLVEYERIFVSPVVCIANKETEKSLKKAGRIPPRLSNIAKKEDGSYEATLVVYSVMRIDGFFEKKVQLSQDGKVTPDENPPRLIQKVGEGIKY